MKLLKLIDIKDAIESKKTWASGVELDKWLQLSDKEMRIWAIWGIHVETNAFWKSDKRGKGEEGSGRRDGFNWEKKSIIVTIFLDLLIRPSFFLWESWESSGKSWVEWAPARNSYHSYLSLWCPFSRSVWGLLSFKVDTLWRKLAPFLAGSVLSLTNFSGRMRRLAVGVWEWPF